MGKEKAIEHVFRNWDDSYTALPKFLSALQHFNRDSVVEWFVTRLDNNQVEFIRVFWAFAPSIKGFEHCRPVISIDATHLSRDEVKSRRKTVTKDAVDKGKRLADKGKWIMVDEGKAGRNDIDIEQRFKSSAELEEMYKGNTNSESEYFDKSIDYLSDGEDELMVYEKYVDADQLKKCLTYYSLSNGFSLWFYKSSKEQIIARCGLRPENLKEISKGKQRKGNKYPSASRDEHSKSYGKEILDSNDGSTVKLGVTVNPDDKTYFDRHRYTVSSLMDTAYRMSEQ
ncbi:hypothetical protein Tco_0810341 [Tanacetum coccineum]